MEGGIQTYHEAGRERDAAETSLLWSSKDADLLSAFAGGGEADELELRFGCFADRKFEPGVSEAVFQGLLSYLSGSSLFTPCPLVTMLFKVMTASGDNATLSGTDQFQRFLRDPHDPDIRWNAYTKRRSMTSDNGDFGFRLATAIDTDEGRGAAPDRASIDALARSPKTFRVLLKRYGFTSPDGLFRVDLSTTQTTKAPQVTFEPSAFRSQRVRFEVEIEFIGADRGAGRGMERYVWLVLRYIQRTDFPIARTSQTAELLEYIDSFISDREEARANLEAGKRRQLFLGAMPVSLSLGDVVSDVAGQACIRSPYPHDYTVTEKADGERCLLHVNAEGAVHLIDRECGVRKTGLVSPAAAQTLIDGELIATSRRYLAFDVLFVGGQDVRSLPLVDTADPSRQTRVKHLSRLLASGALSSGRQPLMHVVAKKMHQTDDVVDVADQLWKGRREHYSHHVDGIFFTSREAPYPDVEQGSKTWRTCYKWKPRSLLSIDFCVKSESAVKHTMVDRVLTPYKLAQLHVLSSQPQANKRLKPFAPAEPRQGPKGAFPPFLARIGVDDDGAMRGRDPLTGLSFRFSCNDIVEFAHDPESPSGFEWRPLRLRCDKVVPNLDRTANQVWSVMHEAGGIVASEAFFESVLDPLSLKAMRLQLAETPGPAAAPYYTREESVKDRRSALAVSIRNFHDLVVKERLYLAAARLTRDEASATGEAGVRLLELGVGRGGDYSRWRRAGIGTVVGVDLDKAGLGHLDGRHRQHRAAGEVPRSVSLFQADMTLLLSSGDAGVTAADQQGLRERVPRLHTFDVVSCQFALHYALANETAMMGFMINVHQALRVGGVFIGTVLDGRSVFDLLGKLGPEQDGLDFKTGGQMYARITRRYPTAADGKLEPFGQGVDVWFTSIAGETKLEYLVDFRAFSETMERDFDMVVIPDVEADPAGLPSGSGLFRDLYAPGRGGSKQVAGVRLTEDQQAWSFLNRFFVMKKVGNGDGAVMQKWLKRLRRTKPGPG